MGRQAAETAHARRTAGRSRNLAAWLDYISRSALEGVDAAALVEVIEHLDIDRLPALEKVVFGAARPATVIVSTPNADYNALFPKLKAGAFRHPDHRFEWGRAQFWAWTQRIGEAWGYVAELSGIGKLDDALGAPTADGDFRRVDA